MSYIFKHIINISIRHRVFERLSVIFLLWFSTINFLSAQVTGDYRSYATGNWSDVSKWDRYNGSSWVNNPVAFGYPGQNSVPGTVTIRSGHVITVNVSPAYHIGAITITGTTTTTLTLSSVTLNIDGTINIIHTGTSGTTNVTLDVNTGTVNCNAVVYTQSGNNNRDCNITISTGALNVSNNIIFGATLQRNNLTISGTGTLTMDGSFSGSAAVSYGTGSTVSYSTSGEQTIDATYTSIYYNLNLFGSGTKTLGGAITVNGDINISGTAEFADAGYQITGSSGKTFTLGAGATYTTIRTSKWFATNVSVSLDSASTVKYNANSSFNLPTSVTSYGNLELNAGGTKTLGVATAINGNLTIANGVIFDPANNSVTIKGNWNNNNAVASSGFTEGAGTVIFSGAGTQSINHAGGTETFYNFTVANSGNTATLNSNVIVSNKLDFTTSGYISLNTRNLTITNWNSGDIPTLGIDRFVIVDNTGFFKVANVANGQTVNFPIGLASGSTNYARVDILNSSGSASDFDINLCDYVNDAGTCSGGTEYTTRVIDYSWNIVSTCNNAIITIYWDASKELPMFDRANMCIAHYTGGTWSKLPTIGSATNFSGTVYYFSDVTTSFSKFAGEKSNGPLPIELLSFKANCDKNKVNIEWSTATETGNDYFTIERSRELNNWNPLAEVDGAGDSYNVINYLYTDENPYTDINYYRLKQTDFDGKYSYSGPVSANCYVNSNNLEINEIIFSNDNLIITLNSDKGGLHHFNLYDYNGKMIVNENITTEAGNNVLTYNIPSLSDGVYILTIYNNSKSVTKKILVQ